MEYILSSFFKTFHVPMNLNKKQKHKIKQKIQNIITLIIALRTQKSNKKKT